MSAGVKAIILTLVLAACVYLAGNSRVQLWDRDEPRYAECSRQMLESGDWVVPRLYDKLRFQKPPLIYWCQASAMRVLGRQGNAGAFAARLPSVIGVFATLLMLAVAVGRYSGIGQAKWTVFVLATSAMVIVAAKTCLTDGVLNFFVIAAQLCFFLIWQGNRSWRVAILFAISLGLGILTKGPFILGIVATTGAALGMFNLLGKIRHRRHAKSSRGFAVATANSSPAAASELDADLQADIAANGTVRASNPLRTAGQIAIGLMIIGAIVMPWLWLIQHRAPDFLPAMLHEGKQHALEGKEGHHLPPGYHLVLVWPMFMPWSLLLPLAIGVGIQHRKLPQIRFALAALVGPWLMVEFMGTKLPHYFLPAYPAMAFLVAFAIRKCLAGQSKGIESRPFFIGAGFWAFAVAVVGATPWVAVRWFRPLRWGSMAALTVSAIAVAVIVFVLFKTRRFAPAFITMGVGMCLLIGVATPMFEQAQYLRVSTNVGKVLHDAGATGAGDVKMVDYKEPSLAFYQGGSIREVEKKGDLIYKPVAQWPHWVVITRQAWNMTPAATRKNLRVLYSCKGWAYADRGRVVEVLVIKNELY